MTVEVSQGGAAPLPAPDDAATLVQHRHMLRLALGVTLSFICLLYTSDAADD